jgi:hypothetical protein
LTKQLNRQEVSIPKYRSVNAKEFPSQQRYYLQQ